MKVLKGFALTILSLLLGLSLSIFSLLFMLNSTILNPNFITRELDRIDVSTIVEETLSEQASGEEFPEEFKAALVNTIAKFEPIVKEQIGAAIDPVYDYLLGRSESIDLALTLKNTFLSPDFIASLMEELDISALAGEFLGEQFAEQIPEGMEFLAEYLDEAIAELEPAIKAELIAAAGPISDYLLGESQSLDVEISLEPVIESLREPLKEAFIESLPPEAAQLPQSVIDRYFEQEFAKFTEGIPETLALDEAIFPPGMPAQLAEALAEAEGTLEEIRQYVGYFQLTYKLLIVFMVLLIVGIVFINRLQIKSITRQLGSTFLPIGALSFAGVLVAKYFGGAQLAKTDIPSFLQGWLPQFVNNFLAPLQWFSLGILIAGVALIVTSFVYKPREPSL